MSFINIRLLELWPITFNMQISLNCVKANLYSGALCHSVLNTNSKGSEGHGCAELSDWTTEHSHLKLWALLISSSADNRYWHRVTGAEWDVVNIQGSAHLQGFRVMNWGRFSFQYTADVFIRFHPIGGNRRDRSWFMICPEKNPSNFEHCSDCLHHSETIKLQMFQFSAVPPKNEATIVWRCHFLSYATEEFVGKQLNSSWNLFLFYLLFVTVTQTNSSLPMFLLIFAFLNTILEVFVLPVLHHFDMFSIFYQVWKNNSF